LALASQLPWQLALQFALQSADGGVALHWALQLPLHVAWQDASHSLWLFAFEHLALQSPLQLPSQFAEQSNEPGFTLHDAVHSPVHDALQSTDALALQLPLHDAWSWAAQAASKLMGVHFAVQPPDVSTVHCAFARTSMFPQDSIPAWATRGAKKRKEAAPSPSEMARSRFFVEVMGKILQGGDKSACRRDGRRIAMRCFDDSTCVRSFSSRQRVRDTTHQR
jgi:hypothetical protein